MSTLAPLLQGFFTDRLIRCHPPLRMSTRQGSRAVDGVVLM